MVDIYGNIKQACRKRGTTITNSLISIGRSSANTGSWKSGNFPRVDLLIDLAAHLNVSLDELVFGDDARAVVLTADEQLWLDLFSRIPFERRQACYDFLRTHEAVPSKFVDKMDA